MSRGRMRLWRLRRKMTKGHAETNLGEMQQKRFWKRAMSATLFWLTSFCLVAIALVRNRMVTVFNEHITSRAVWLCHWLDHSHTSPQMLLFWSIWSDQRYWEDMDNAAYQLPWLNVINCYSKAKQDGRAIQLALALKRLHCPLSSLGPYESEN